MSIDQVFEVTEQHLKLLSHMWVDWDDSCYDGAPAVNIKRPYGNSDVLTDVAEILDLCPENPDENCYDNYEWREMWVEENEKMLLALHKETRLALQCCLRAGKFEAGKFVRDMYQWRPAASDSEFQEAQREQARVEERKRRDNEFHQAEMKRRQVDEKKRELKKLEEELRQLDG